MKLGTIKSLCIVAILIAFQFTTLLDLSAQDQKLFKSLFRNAESHVIAEEYGEAIQIYDQLISLDSTNRNLHFLIGYCHQNFDSDMEITQYHLEQAVLDIDVNYSEGSHLERSSPPVAFFMLGKNYQKDFKFDMAIEAFNNYIKYLDKFAVAEVEYVNRYISSCELAKEMVLNPLPVEYVSLDSLTMQRNSVFHPVFSGNEAVMIYSTESPEGNILAMIEKVDSVSWTKPRFIDSELAMRGSYHPVSLSYEGDELYLAYRENSKADIYSSKYDGSRWSEAEPLSSPVNSKYVETHASISSDNNTLYFTSDRKDGYGGLDLYISTRGENGKWSEPVNMGNEVNSFYNEETPFITQNDSALYFSSEGHATMGGFDVFYALINEEGNFSKAKNIGYPISTPNNDLFYNPGWNGSKAYQVRPSKTETKQNEIYAVIKLEDPLEFQIDTTGLNIKEKIEFNELVVKKSAAYDPSSSLDDEQVEMNEAVAAETVEQDSIDEVLASVQEELINEQEEIVPGEPAEESRPANIQEDTTVQPEELSAHPGYIIQVMALKKPVKLEYFTMLENVKMYVGEDGFHRYTYGHYATIDQALQDIGAVRKKGFKTAFIRSLRYYENMLVE